MGEKLVKFYADVGTELGSMGRMKLAMLTRIPSTEALKAEDSSANLKKFEEALAAVRKELPKKN